MEGKSENTGKREETTVKRFENSRQTRILYNRHKSTQRRVPGSSSSTSGMAPSAFILCCTASLFWMMRSICGVHVRVRIITHRNNITYKGRIRLLHAKWHGNKQYRMTNRHSTTDYKTQDIGIGDRYPPGKTSCTRGHPSAVGRSCTPPFHPPAGVTVWVTVDWGHSPAQRGPRPPLASSASRQGAECRTSTSACTSVCVCVCVEV